MSNVANAPSDVVGAGQAWLALLDSESYSNAWEGAAASMHSCISQTDFEKDMRSSRAPWGRMQSRSVKSQRHVARFPGLPEGDGWIISYTTTFENRPNVVESIVLALQQDGNWRVTGYTLP